MGYRREVKAWFFMLHLPTPHHLSQKAKGASRCSLGRAKARPLHVEWGGLEGAEVDGGGHFEVAAEGVG